jgi:hypothetical protein
VKRLLRSKSGSTSVIFFGLVFVLVLLALMIMEMGAIYQNYYDAETILQRCCNSAVESNMLDAYRADHILCLDVTAAKVDLYQYLDSDMPDKFKLTVSSITGTATPPTLIVTGSVSFSTLFKQYDFDNITFDFTVASANYRVS